MKLLKTVAVLLLAVCISGQVFAGGRGDASAGGSQKLHFMAGDWEGYLNEINAVYKQKTGVEVTLETYSFNDLFQMIEVKIASGSKDYDVFSVDVPMVAGYAHRGYIAPMDKYFSTTDKAKIMPAALAAGSWKGVLYSPPMNTSSQILWYNKDALAKAEVTVRESSITNRLTYEEVLTYVQQALAKLDPDRKNGIAGLVFEQVSRTYQMCAVANSMGEKNIGDDGFVVNGIINSPGWIKAMTWYSNLYKDGLSLRGNVENVDLFKSGKILFIIGGTWNTNNFKDVNYGFAPVPAFKGYEDKVGTPTGSWHFGINKASTKQDLAGAYIKWLSVEEGNDLWLEKNHDVPSTLSAAAKIENDPNGDPIYKIAAYEAGHTAVPRALTPGYPEYSTIMDATFEDIRNGSDVKRSLDSAVQQINLALAKYK
jgi:ABC-type glycerol-3-phosphate transport system substrate-binding protein